MAGTARALTAGTLGAWLVKARGAEASTYAHVAARFAGVEGWCVRPTYRTALVAAGQPVLLWVSGHEEEMPAGIYAQGWTTGPAREAAMPVALEALSHPLLRSELAGHPDLARMEVLRMPAGSNPSFVTRDQLLVLTGLSPELTGLARTPGERKAHSHDRRPRP